VLINAFVDDAYNRARYMLVSHLSGGGLALPPLHCATLDEVVTVFEAVDFGSHARALLATY
jgi:hypothetical protein